MPDTYIVPLELHAVGCPCCGGRGNSDDEPQAAIALTTTIPGVSAYDLSSVDLRALLAYRSDTDAAGNFVAGANRWNFDMTAGKGLTLQETLNSTVGVGSGVTLGYSFAQAVSGASAGTSGFRPMNAIEKQIVVEQLAKWSAVANVTFTETTENTSKTLSFGTDTFSANLAPAVGLGAYPGAVSYIQDSAGMNYGWYEDRDPSAYLDANSDLKAAGVNPLAHYLQYGQGEGRLLVATADLGLDWTYLG